MDVDPQVIREAIENPNSPMWTRCCPLRNRQTGSMKRSCTGSKRRPPRMTERPARRCGPPRGTFHVDGYEPGTDGGGRIRFSTTKSEDGKYLIMANGSRAFAIPNGDTPEHTARRS